MKIKAILFDLDGVLLDACEWHYEALNRALEEVVEDRIEREEHEQVFNGLPTLTKLNMLAKAGRIEKDQMRHISGLKQKYTFAVIEELATKDHQKIAILRLLRAEGFRIACVTNSIRESAILMLRKAGLYNTIELLISNEDIKNPKPHPEGYWKAMAYFGVMPEETLIIEDSEKGQAAAKASGANLLTVKNATDLTWLKLAQALS